MAILADIVKLIVCVFYLALAFQELTKKNQFKTAVYAALAVLIIK